MVYDAPTGVLHLFGGNGLCDPAMCDDTWVWYGPQRSWGQLMPSTRPPGRYGAGLARTQAIGAPVLFGGFAILGPRPGATVLGGTQTFDDTWLWNEGWTDAMLTSSPRARSFAAMVGNDADGSIVLFGGSGVQGAETVILGDTWTLVATPRP
jgi:hypothetical protein